MELIQELLKNIQPREEVMMFARLMEFKLRKNAKKKGSWPSDAYDENRERSWKEMTLDYLRVRLDEERQEFLNEFFPGHMYHRDAVKTMLELADMGNFEMMMVDHLLNGRDPQ